MKSDEIHLFFATKLETYASIEGQPSDPDLSALQETLTALLLPIVYDEEKGINNLVGLIMYEDAYKLRHGANFLTPSSLAIYDVNIPIDASNAVRIRREADHTAKKEDYRLFAAANRKTIKFILAVVEIRGCVNYATPVYSTQPSSPETYSITSKPCVWASMPWTV